MRNIQFGSHCIEYSSQALSFLKKCNYKFVDKFVKRNHKNGKKMNPILSQLNLKTPGHWEKFTESHLKTDLDDEEAKKNLEECVSICNRRDKALDILGKSYEEQFEDFKKDRRSAKKPDFTCPKCVKYLPARHLVKIRGEP